MTDSLSELNNEIRRRFRDELSRLRLSLAAASAAIGDSSRSRVKNITSGNQRCPSDVLARLAPIGVDVCYVLTGVRLPEIWRDQIARVLRIAAETDPRDGEPAAPTLTSVFADPPAEYGDLSADERQLLALFRRADLSTKMRTVAVLDGVDSGRAAS